VLWISQPAPAPMGQEMYEAQARAALLRQEAPDLTFRNLVVRSMRSQDPGDRRLPSATLSRAPRALRLAVTRVSYPRHDLAHRWNVRLPAARRDIVTFHDAAPLRYDDEGEVPPGLQDVALHSVGVICPSAFAAQEAQGVLGVRRTWVAPGGVDERFFGASPPSAATLTGLGITGPYVLHAGGATKRKNLAALAEAWPAVRAAHPDLQLVLTGPEDERRTALFSALPGTRLLGRVDDDLIPPLVAGAEAVVVPSTYEGFGLPVLEAMAASTPTVVANAASLPEVAGDAARLVEPTADGVADGLLDVLSDSSLADELRQRGLWRAGYFTWFETAQAHLRAYREALDT
jgi:glycosyltransferase involved in cell wall biosynthesis